MLPCSFKSVLYFNYKLLYLFFILYSYCLNSFLLNDTLDLLVFYYSCFLLLAFKFTREDIDDFLDFNN